MSDSQATTSMTISTGVLTGAQDAGIRRFLGVPYAAPPFGDRRFRLPEPPEPWTAARDATRFGPTAPQDPYPGAIGELLGSVEIPGTDILTLNVWTPSDADVGDALPVMVWLHGGALERGTPALSAYDGTTFTRDGIVFVSIAYRLGAEGFSVLDGVPRNLGLADAAAGLRWVHEEIAAFGGDPSRVTIVGESAGGALVAALLARPDTAPLIAGAVIESGPLVADSPVRAGRVTRALAKKLGVAATRDAFAAVSPERLLAARRDLAAGASPLGGAPGYSLAVDPDTLPISPHEALIAASAPLVIGSNTDEYRLWFPPAALASITPVKLLLARLALRIPRRAIRAYREAWPTASTGELFGQLATDVILRRALVDLADARRRPTFVYEFAWPSPVRDLRAAHAMEIGFVFDGLSVDDSVRMAGSDAPQELADRMHGDWVRFIRTGAPGWPEYADRAGETARAGAARNVRVYAEESRVVPLPRAAAVDSLPSPRQR